MCVCGEGRGEERWKMGASAHCLLSHRSVRAVTLVIVQHTMTMPTNGPMISKTITYFSQRRLVGQSLWSFSWPSPLLTLMRKLRHLQWHTHVKSSGSHWMQQES